MKYVIVGGVAGGGSAAARIRRLDENAEIMIYEKGPNTSFSNCCLPNFLSREVPTSDDLILFSVDEFKQMFNLPAKVNHEVLKIKADEHKVVVKNLLTGEEFEDSYDKLVLAPGAAAIRPGTIKGSHNENVFVVKNVRDIKLLDDYIHQHNVEDIVVVGGGFIGLECAECLRHAGKNVSVVEALNQVMTPFDYDMVQILHKEIVDNGIQLYVEERVTEITGDKVLLASGKELKAQAVIMAVGIRPDVKFAVESGVELGELGGIKVDHNFRTNLPDVFAVGDAVEVYNAITYKKTMLPLAGPAQRQARMAVDTMFGRPVDNRGVIGSSCIRVFNMHAARTGLNEKDCQAAGIDYRTVRVAPMDKVGLMPDAQPIHFKLIYQYPSGKVLGAQAVGRGEVNKRVDVCATMIYMNGTIDDLKELELCYSPPFGTAKDAVNHAAFAASNLLNGEFKQVPIEKVRGLVESGAYIIDAREPGAYAKSHIKGAHNIPLSQIRERWQEVPTDRPVYIHCRTSWYSYYALRCLQGHGYRNVTNIQGSMLGLSYYEWFDDQRLNRDPILTGYNFN